MQQTDYYPFGLAIPRDNPAQSENHRNGVNRYLYNEKELQVGTGYLDYGARMYMPEIDRWGIVDPLAEETMDPYGYCYNSPVNFIDPDGRNPIKGLKSTYNVGKKAYKTYKKTGKVDIGKALKNEVLDIVDNVSTLLDGNLNADDAFAAIDLLTGFGDEAKSVSKIIGIADNAKDIRLDAKKIKNARQSAVRNAWKQEKALIESGSEGTRNWTKKELKELKETGKVKGYQGHHINNVKHHPEQAGDPNNIEFVNKKEHLQKHNGNYRNETTGELKNRK